MYERVGKQSRVTGSSAVEAVAPVPGRQTLVDLEARRAVQMFGVPGRTGDEARVHAAAERGIATPSTRLPFADSLQRAFGRHDISGIQAHAGGEAAAAAGAMGAQAYASGNHVVLGKGTDLFTVAHEAAHVVQQRAGVHLKGGVGAESDAYEQHADQVAALVVQGKSAESLLDQYGVGGGGGGSGGGGVQRRMDFDRDTDYLNINGAGSGIDLDGYKATQREAIAMSNEIAVREGTPKVGAAAYTPSTTEITVRPLKPTDITGKTSEYHDRLIAMAHETRHGIDDLTKTVRFRSDDLQKIHTEWRAFATQSAVAMQLRDRSEPFPSRYLADIASFADRRSFMASGSAMIGTTASYMTLYKLAHHPSEQEVQKFMRDHVDWVDEAVALFHSLVPQQIPVPLATTALRPPTETEEGWNKKLVAIGVTAGVIATGIVIKLLGTYFEVF